MVSSAYTFVGKPVNNDVPRMLAAKVSFRYFGIFLFITISSFDFYYVIVQDNNIYFNGDGRLIKNTEIIIEGKRYKADENGILMLVDTSKENGWRLAGNNWYYYENGALIKDSFKEINGVRYHFEKDGRMSTGAFYPDPMSPICYLAEPNGEVVNGKHGWYHSSQTDKWYWFNGADSLILNSLVKDAGKKYYVGYDGAMQTGVFWISTYDEDKKEYVSEQIYADESGVINEQQGWKKDSAGNWYYVKKDGLAAV